ncbi:MAG TPA: protein kinase [Thermoanaerobaculaceae bacterium]|nr:protein kinase [Thermoanaerobaculaceae bacterium]HRS15031.1 protein kinase [Thermoanaerobaculaceae bacterium]
MLGAGGSGVVFEAEDLELRQRVAVKVIHPYLAAARSLERLRREVRVARGHHEHVVAVYDLHEVDGLRFLSMELVAGASLGAVLAAGNPLPVHETIALGRQVASALAFFHGRGLIHRDVKPSNILLAGAGGESDSTGGHRWTAKLCDLGLARSLEPGITVTETAMVVGTPAYMAPEQATGDDLTPASDVYALGLVLWECLTGQIPFRGDTAVATLVKRQSSRPPRLRSERPDAPAWLARLLAAMLDPQPRRRPSAAEVERSLASGQVGRRPPWRSLAAAAAVLLVAGASLAGWRALARGATVRVEAAGREVAGYDRRGRATWRHTLENPVQQVERADLDGDGLEEVLVAAYPETGSGLRSDRLPLSEFLIVNRSGALTTHIRPEQLVRSWNHPFPLRLAVGITLADVDGDGAPEVLLNARQRSFFPNQVLLYWPRHGVWDWALDHSGYLMDLAAVPGRSGQIAVVGVNNRLGMQPVFGVWSVVPPGLRRKAVSGTLLSPDYGMEATPTSRWLLYVPLSAELWRREGEGGSYIVPAADDGFAAVFNGKRVRVDARGNPEGPNWGWDRLAQRGKILARIAGLLNGDAVGSAALVEAKVGRLESEMAELLAEPPYRAMLALAAARAFARVGATARAREVLLPAVSNEDVAFRLANLEAMEGRIPDAVARTWRLVESGHSPRSGFDAQRLLLDLAVETRDGAELERAIAAWVRFVNAPTEMHAGLVPAFWARARLWWDEATAADGRLRSSPFADEGEAVACLARWRLKQASAADAAAMDEYVRAGFEGAPLGLAAHAAVLLSTGASGDALHLLNRLVNELQWDATWDLRTRQYQDLARALRAHALAAVGRPEQARAEAERLLADRGPDLLPGILAREVLDELARAETTER